MDAVEEIKQRLSIEDVVSEYVQLKRAGRNWKGLSPFSNERTPSFMVSPEKQIWHDFSSGKGGNVFSFVMEMEGLDFKGALELLARKAGVDLDQFRGKPGGGNGKSKERLYEVLELATRFYQVQFSRSKTALEYVLKKRQFSKETALAWRIGYSPNNGSALVDFLKNKKFTEEEIKGAGLSAQRYRGVQDMFRGRIMIPLSDPQGRVIGFTARLLVDDPEAPKYINTPQTPLYDKSRHIYGLHFAKEAIRKQKFVVIAEGQLDVISSHQAGVKMVVATAGTALTEPHLKALSRFTGDIRLSFDADKAGVAATERAIPIAAKVNVNLSVIDIPAGKDPDELIKKDVKLWQEVINKPQYAVDWLLQKYQQEIDVTGAQGKRQFSDTVLAVIRGLSDPVEREHYVRQVADTLGVSAETIMNKLQQKAVAAQPRLKKPAHKPASPEQTASYSKVQNHFLSLTLMHKNLRKLLDPITPEMMLDENARALLKFLQTNPDFDGDPTKAKKLQPIGDYVKILVLHYEEYYQDVEQSELPSEAADLQVRLIEQYVKMQKQNLITQLRDADEATSTALMQQANQLDQLLQTLKGSE